MRKINEIIHKLGINSHKLYFALLILRSTSKSTRMFEMTNKVNNIVKIELNISCQMNSKPPTLALPAIFSIAGPAITNIDMMANVIRIVPIA